MKDTATQREKRCIAALSVHIVFQNPVNFDVVEFDPLIVAQSNKIKYFGKVTADKKNDQCSCDSYFYGMKFSQMEDGSKGESQYVADNGFPFTCKHIFKARFIRFGEKIE